MNTTVKLSDTLASLTKNQVATYSIVIGAIVGMFIQSTIGLSGLLVLVGVFFIFKYFSNNKKE